MTVSRSRNIVDLPQVFQKAFVDKAQEKLFFARSGIDKEAARFVAAYTEYKEKRAFSQSQYGATGGFVDFHQVSSQPGFRKPRLERVVDKEVDKIAGPITPGGLTPASRLASSMRIGKPRITSPSGPSIGDIAKPKGFGGKLPGATLSA